MRYRALVTAAAVTAMLFGLGACDKGTSGDGGNSAAQSREATTPEVWSFAGSKRDIVESGDARKNLLETCQYFYPEEMNKFAAEGTPWLVGNKHDGSKDSPVRLCVSNENNSKWGTTFVATTRVDKPGADKLYGQFRSALGSSNARDFDHPLPQGIDRAFWITRGDGMITGVVYGAGEVTVSLNFTKPQPEALFLDQMNRAAPTTTGLYKAFYETPAS